MIQVKKLLFVRTMTILDDSAVCKKILVSRTHNCIVDMEKGRINEHNSPIFEILKAAEDVGIFGECINMIINGYFYPKEGWRCIVWNAIWKCEDEDNILIYKNPKPDTLLYKIIENAYYLIW